MLLAVSMGRRSNRGGGQRWPAKRRKRWPEALGASSSRILRKEGKVGVWFPGLNDNGVVRKGGDGESRAESCRSAAVVGRGLTASPTDRQCDG
jgi:hypothetical protein